jgi:O-antigen/teichoic acid export membrane protein
MKLKAYLLSGFFAKVGFTLTLFLVNMLIARLLGAADSGTFFYTVNNLSVIILVSSLSLESGLSYHLAKKNISEQGAAGLSIAWSVGAAVLSAIIVLFTLHIPLGFALLFISGNLLIGFFSGLFYAKKDFLIPLLIQALANLLIILYIFWVFVSHEQVDVSLLMWIYFGSYLLAGFSLAVVFFAKYTLNSFTLLSLTGVFRSVIAYSFIAFIANLVAFLVYRVDYWILEYYIPTHITGPALGNYIQVAKGVQLFLFAPTVLATVILPLTAADDASAKPEGIKKILLRISAINIVLILVLIIAGRWLFTFIYGNDFELMYNCFLYLIPGVLAISCVRVLASYFAGLNKVKYNLAGSLFALVLIVGLNFILIPSMGINGAALADSAGYVAYLLFLFYKFQKSGRA